MNFEELEIRLSELYDIKIYTDNSENENFKPVRAEFNEVFLNLVKASINEKKFFSCSPLDLFEIALKERIEILEQSEFDFDENEYIMKIYKEQCNLFSSNVKKNEAYYYISYLNNENYNLFHSIIKKRINYLEKLLYKKGIEVIVTYPNGDTSRIERKFKKHFNLMVENDNLQPLRSTPKPKTNKSLLFNGKELNLSERFKIANEVLGIDNKIRKLKIADLEKYQLLAYILGCDKDNARNLMNGSYKTKDRDLSTYFNDLGLNK